MKIEELQRQVGELQDRVLKLELRFENAAKVYDRTIGELKKITRRRDQVD